MKRASLDYFTSSASKLFRLRSAPKSNGNEDLEGELAVGRRTRSMIDSSRTTRSNSSSSSSSSDSRIKSTQTTVSEQLQVLRQSQHLGNGQRHMPSQSAAESTMRSGRTDSVTDSSDTDEDDDNDDEEDDEDDSEGSSAISIVFDGGTALSAVRRRSSPDWFVSNTTSSTSSSSSSSMKGGQMDSISTSTLTSRPRSKSALPSSLRAKPSSVRRTAPRPRRSSVSDSIRASISKTRIGLPSVKQKGRLLRCENVLRWCEMEQNTRKRSMKCPTIVWVRRVSKVSVAFNYVSLLKHHFIILELYQGPKKVGYLASQIVNNGDITMYVYSDWKSAIRHGQCGASFGGKPSEKQASVVKTSGMIDGVSLNDFSRFMEDSVPKEYNLITHNCLVVSEAIYKHLSAFET